MIEKCLFPCVRLCKDSNTARHHCGGTSGRCVPVEVSQRIVELVLLIGTAQTVSDIEDDE